MIKKYSAKFKAIKNIFIDKIKDKKHTYLKK